MVLGGRSGFLTAVDEQTLSVQPQSHLGRRFLDQVTATGSLGLLAINFATRRRAKLKGTAEVTADGRVLMHTERVYALCPKYIQQRVPDRPPDDRVRAETTTEAHRLSDRQRARIAEADTFFLATCHDESGADASHRGGPPGFVTVKDDRTLQFPDYPGNNMFNSFGNLVVDPRAGLVFPDFETGGGLQMTGVAAVDWQPTGARRVEFRVETVIELGSTG